MPINPIDSPALDFALRESPPALARIRPNSGPVPAAPATGVNLPSAGTAADSGTDPAAPEQTPDSPQAATAKQSLAPNYNLKFSSDQETGKAVVALVDPASGEVLRQMPSEEALQVAKAIGRFQGVLIDTKA